MEGKIISVAIYKMTVLKYYYHHANINVVVNFLSQVIFDFVLFLGTVMYANEVERKWKINITWDKKLTSTFLKMWIHLPKILHPTNTYDTTFELNKISWMEGDHKKGKGSPYILPLITGDL